MAIGYSRQSSFIDGDVILAEHGNAEFNHLLQVFDNTSGHDHDGTEGGGTPIPFIQKGTTGVYVDTSNPSDPKVLFKINGATVNTTSGSYLGTSANIKHTPDGGTAGPLGVYLDALAVEVGDAAADAAAASISADRAEAAAMTLGVPVILADGENYTILDDTVQVDIICLGDSTITLPTVLTAGFRYSLRVSSIATETKRCTIVNPNFYIIGDVLTLEPGDDLELKPKEIAILDTISSTQLEII